MKLSVDRQVDIIPDVLSAHRRWDTAVTLTQLRMDRIEDRTTHHLAHNLIVKFKMPKKTKNVAFALGRLRKDGVLVLAKTNMQEFALGGVSISSIGAR
jgi:hypothetical protein